MRRFPGGEREGRERGGEREGEREFEFFTVLIILQ
jgi:hypothetical protein